MGIQRLFKEHHYREKLFKCKVQILFRMSLLNVFCVKDTVANYHLENLSKYMFCVMAELLVWLHQLVHLKIKEISKDYNILCYFILQIHMHNN